MENIAIPDSPKFLIKQLFRNAPCKPRFKGQESKAFDMNTGDIQGCTLSTVSSGNSSPSDKHRGTK